MKLEPGMRVRCVDARNSFGRLAQGFMYVVDEQHCDQVYLRTATGGVSFPYHRSRFHPVVRVKAGAVYSGKAFDRMSPEQKEAHREEQRKYWMRGESSAGDRFTIRTGANNTTASGKPR